MTLTSFAAVPTCAATALWSYRTLLGSLVVQRRITAYLVNDAIEDGRHVAHVADGEYRVEHLSLLAMVVS